MTKQNWNSDKPTQSRLLKASEVAKILNISRSHAYNLMQANEIPNVRIRNARRVREIDLQNYIKDNLTSANPQR